MMNCCISWSPLPPSLALSPPPSFLPVWSLQRKHSWQVLIPPSPSFLLCPLVSLFLSPSLSFLSGSRQCQSRLVRSSPVRLRGDCFLSETYRFAPLNHNISHDFRIIFSGNYPSDECQAGALSQIHFSCTWTGSNQIYMWCPSSQWWREWPQRSNTWPLGSCWDVLRYN